MIYWEITLRDHLLLPITPDSSGDTTYARGERDRRTALPFTVCGREGQTVRAGLAQLCVQPCSQFGF